MNDFEFALRELDRRLSNLARVGRVVSVSLESTVPKVRIGLGELVTGWLPFMSARAGNDRQWWPIEVDEQVLVISPSGDLTQGFVLGSFFHERFAPLTREHDKVRTDYADGAYTQYDKAEHRLDVHLPQGGSIYVQANGSLKLTATGGVHIDGDLTINGQLTASGDVSDGTRSMEADRTIYNTHTHGGVSSGSSQSAVSSTKQ